jgi:hypothetical protein
MLRGLPRRALWAHEMKCRGLPIQSRRSAGSHARACSVDAVSLHRRRVEHGRLSVGLKIHCLGDGKQFSTLVAGLGGRTKVLDINYYKHSRASLCLVLPPVGNARSAILLLECIGQFIGSALFSNPAIQIQVCSPGRLDARRSALLAIGGGHGSCRSARKVSKGRFWVSSIGHAMRRRRSESKIDGGREDSAAGTAGPHSPSRHFAERGGAQAARSGLAARPRRATRSCRGSTRFHHWNPEVDPPAHSWRADARGCRRRDRLARGADQPMVRRKPGQDRGSVHPPGRPVSLRRRPGARPAECRGGGLGLTADGRSPRRPGRCGASSWSSRCWRRPASPRSTSPTSPPADEGRRSGRRACAAGRAAAHRARRHRRNAGRRGDRGRTPACPAGPTLGVEGTARRTDVTLPAFVRNGEHAKLTTSNEFDAGHVQARNGRERAGEVDPGRFSVEASTMVPPANEPSADVYKPWAQTID